MFEHHRRAVVEADATGEFPRLRTENVKRLALDPLPKAAFKVEVDGQVIDVEPLRPVYLLRRGEKWSRSDSYRELHKRPRVMGPIDDAFTRPFLVVVGTGTPWNPLNGAYAQQLLERMRKEWRLGFRGELNVIPDTQVSRDEPPPVGMVLLGDPGSNSVLRSLVGKLPIRWTKEGLQMGGEKYDANHFPVMVFPHPLNNAVYLVINSGHTFTERDLLASNTNLTPKLPDWAVMRHEAAAPVVVDAGFFTEEWRMPRRAGRD
jgi:hypothetical protein